MVMSFLYHGYRSMQANGITHGEKWIGVGNDGRSKMVSLYSIIYDYVSSTLYGMVTSERSF